MIGGISKGLFDNKKIVIFSKIDNNNIYSGKSMYLDYDTFEMFVKDKKIVSAKYEKSQN
jgi:hypothetical protein